MQKIYVFFCSVFFVFNFAQCTIDGSDQIQVGEKQNYFAAKNQDCKDCYQWIHLDQKVILESDTNKNEITLKGTVPGEAILFLEIASEKGISKCQKLIQVTVPTTEILPAHSSKCDLAIDSFREIRVAGNQVIFEPETSENNLTYLWTVTYRSGAKKVSSARKAGFEYSNDDVIDHVDLKVVFNKCIKKISKVYDANFWYFF